MTDADIDLLRIGYIAFLLKSPSGIICLTVLWMLVALVVDWSPDLRNLAYTLSHRHLSGQWRLGLFVGLCCMAAGVVYGWVVW